ncbi:MAG: PKD domain-containing protein [Chromatiales bacterium]|nr:MAG: PKD domain-containing protein [Chromatiales bacterium]
MSKASSTLARAFAEYRAHVAQRRTTAFEPTDQFLQFAGGRVLVDARATASGDELLADLRQLGLTQGAHAGEVVSGLLPLAALDRAVALSSLRAIAASPRPITHTGSINSQGDIALRADVARDPLVHDVDGTGVTVGVLSDAYDTLNGAAADIASGDLPTGGVPVLNGESTLCGSLIFCIDEGRAMLQIVHDIAPAAGLLFHTGLGGNASYANAITDLAAAGADVIVDDLMYLNEPMFQDGVVAQAVDSVVAGGVAYYSAAGNSGRNSYVGPFADSGVIFCIEFFFPIGDCDPIFERVGRMHDFDPGPGVDLYQNVTVPVDSVLTIAMQWDEPFGGPGSRTDYDIVLLDQSGGLYFEISANDNVATGEGWEVLQFQNAAVLGYGTAFSVIITYDDVDSIGAPTNLMKTVVFGSSTIDEFATNSSTLMGHANAAGAQAVGAAFFAETPEYGVSPPTLEPYSSAGGTPILFNANGTPRGSAEVRAKPEMTAADGVNTTFFFNDSDGNDGIDDFFGTSAAAPHAAGIAALMLQAKPTATPAQLKSALQNTAIDMNAPGFDHDSGYGLVQADAAIANLLAAAGNNPPMASFTTSVAGLQVDFTDTSSDSDGSVVGWAWDFGDGMAAGVQNPSHAYGAGGTYTVTLTVTDDDGSQDATSQSVTVSETGSNAPPVASFSYTCSGRDCTFDGRSSSDDVEIVSYAWDFGDGGNSTAVSPGYTYASTGNYTVTLVVSDIEAASDSASASFRVKNRGNTSGSSGGSSDGGDTSTVSSEKGRKKCTDGADNDGDGLVDGADPDCQ